MAKETSAGAVVFATIRGRRNYLLLRYPPSVRTARAYWDLPKGHVEEGESEEATMRREVAEETGLRGLRLVGGFKERITYHFSSEGRAVRKTVTFYLAESKSRSAKVSHEHIGFVWLPFEEALTHLKFENAKTVVKKAHDHLSRKGGGGRQTDSQGKGRDVPGGRGGRRTPGRLARRRQRA